MLPSVLGTLDGVVVGLAPGVATGASGPEVTMLPELFGMSAGLCVEAVGLAVGLAEHGAADSQLAGSVLAGQCDKGPTPGGFKLDPSYKPAQSASVSQSPNPHLHPSSAP